MTSAAGEPDSVPLLSTTPEFDLSGFSTPARGRVRGGFSMSSPALHVVNNADQLNHDPAAAQVESTAVDWDLVAVLRQQVSKREAEGRPASAAADVSVREERARSIIGEVLEEAA